MPIFPQWIDRLRPLWGLILVLVPAYVLGMAYYASDPGTVDVGFSPVQPVPFSHALHAGQLNLDCRYCHTTVENAAHAAIPSTEICMNCHSTIATDSPKLALVRESFVTGEPIPWVRVHDLPDFAYFDHSAHVTRGISCVSCHGRIDKMERVTQVEPLRMGWCLKCHRHPENHVRPKELVTKLDWRPDGDAVAMGRELVEQYNLHPSTDCSTCHR